MPLTDQLFQQDKKAIGSASIVSTVKNQYLQNKETYNAVAQGLVMIGVLRLAADYLQSKWVIYDIMLSRINNSSIHNTAL